MFDNQNIYYKTNILYCSRKYHKISHNFVIILYTISKHHRAVSKRMTETYKPCRCRQQMFRHSLQRPPPPLALRPPHSSPPPGHRGPPEATQPLCSTHTRTRANTHSVISQQDIIICIFICLTQ